MRTLGKVHNILPAVHDVVPVAPTNPDEHMHCVVEPSHSAFPILPHFVWSGLAQLAPMVTAKELHCHGDKITEMAMLLNGEKQVDFKTCPQILRNSKTKDTDLC